mmetsp:Transcript_32012/g.39273  ORF Transcript_32012/g.39273 Transcript_32012/m.39273 type:complete len:235 (+) Transcript_32012:376-1080(+)
MYPSHPYNPMTTGQQSFRMAFTTDRATTADVRGLVLEGAASTCIAIVPAAPRKEISTRLPVASGSATRLASVSSRPAVAKASIAATLAFLGKVEAASREDPSNNTRGRESARRSGWSVAAGVPSHAWGGLICVTLTCALRSSRRAALPIQSNAGIDPVQRMRRPPLASAASRKSLYRTSSVREPMEVIIRSLPISRHLFPYCLTAGCPAASTHKVQSESVAKNLSASVVQTTES